MEPSLRGSSRVRCDSYIILPLDADRTLQVCIIVFVGDPICEIVET